MGREVRHVPADWEHPSTPRGMVPLRDGFTKRHAYWKKMKEAWDQGLMEDFSVGRDIRDKECDAGVDYYDRTRFFKPREGKYATMTFEEWDGREPRAEDHMPDWPAEERTHLQMYETCTEGTPISPVMATAEELADWLAANGASAFARMTATREQWLAVIRDDIGAPSMVIAGGVLLSGVEAMADLGKTDPKR